MKGKVILAVAVLIAGVVVLSGCVEETTPRGNISAPKTGESISTPFAIGETATFSPSPKEGGQLQVTLVKVIWADCGYSSTYESCVGAFIKVKNTGSEKESDYIYSPELLDDSGKQYDEKYTSYTDNYAEGNIYPGITKEGYIYFKEPNSSAKILKIILPFGVIGATNIVYQFGADEIITPTKSLDLTLGDVKYSWTKYTYMEGGSGYISSIGYTIKNTGEASITPSFDVIITKNGKDVMKTEKAGYLWSALAAGESKSDEISLFQSISESGQYTVKVTARDKDLPTTIATATKSFTVA